MPLPHFGGHRLSCTSCKLDQDQDHLEIKTSNTILRLKGSFSHFEVVKDSLQFFLNCAEDLTQMGERVCILLNMSYHESGILPSEFLGDMFYYVTENGHRAPQEKCQIVHEDQLVETLCSYDWIFMFSQEFEQHAKVLHSVYDKTVVKIKKGSTVVKDTWWRSWSEQGGKKLTITSTEIYQHIWKGSKFTIVDDLELANNLVLL